MTASPADRSAARSAPWAAVTLTPVRRSTNTVWEAQTTRLSALTDQRSDLLPLGALRAGWSAMEQLGLGLRVSVAG
jgi:hypothetical protein